MNRLPAATWASWTVMPNMIRSMPTVLTDEAAFSVATPRSLMGGRVPIGLGGMVAAGTGELVVVTATRVGSVPSACVAAGSTVVPGATLVEGTATTVGA